MSLPRPVGPKSRLAKGQHFQSPTVSPRAPARLLRRHSCAVHGTISGQVLSMPSNLQDTLQYSSSLMKNHRSAAPNYTAELYSANINNLLSAPDLSQTLSLEDTFRVGERVWVGGSKPGVIAYIGETEFAPGDWAGVVLDEPIGKNDGSVAGVRYFQCEAKRGVFSRPAKLTRQAGASGRADLPLTDTLGFTPAAQVDRSNFPSINRNANSPVVGLPTTPYTPDTSSVHTTNSEANGTGLQHTPSPGPLGSAASHNSPALYASPALPGSVGLPSGRSSRRSSLADEPRDSAVRPDLSLGERVVVSGTKVGTLRYIGSTTFAHGDWCGVELDEMLGKNDGSVQGVKYFECKPMYGLFAPIHKVSRVDDAGADAPVVTPSRPRARPISRQRRGRRGSNESLSSVGSSVSATSRGRASVVSRSSVASRTGRAQKPSTSSNSRVTNSSALQEALREKEQHVDQLLKERDMERSEMAGATIRAEEAEKKLSSVQEEHQKKIESLKQEVESLNERVKALDSDKSDVQRQLAEEKQKLEDLQFEMEEKALLESETSDKAGDEANSELKSQLNKMEARYKEERDKAEEKHRELLTMKALYEKERARYKDVEESSVAYLDQVEELTHKLSMAENKLKASKTQPQNNADASDKDGLIAELKSQLQEKDQTVKNLEAKISNMNESVNEIKEKEKEREAVIADLQQKATEVTGTEAGDVNQVIKLNERLKDKEKELADNLAAISAARAESARLREELESRTSVWEREQEEVSAKHAADMKLLEQRLEKSEQEKSELTSQLMESSAGEAAEAVEIKELQDSLAATNKQLIDKQTELQQVVEQVNAVQQQANSSKAEVESLHGHLSTAKDELQSVQEIVKEVQKASSDQAEKYREELQQLNLAQEQLKQEFLNAQEAVRKAEAEREETELQRFKLEEESLGLQSEQSSLKQEREQLVLKVKGLEDIIASLETEKSQFDDSRQKDIRALDDLRTEHVQLQTTHEEMARNSLDLQNKLQQRESQLTETRREIEKAKEAYLGLMKELKQANEATMDDQQQLELLRTQLASSVQASGDKDKQLSESAGRISELEQKLAAVQPQLDTVLRLEADKMSLQEEIDALMEREDEIRKEKAEEIRVIKSELEASQKTVVDKDSEMSKFKKQLAYLQGQSSLMSSYQTQIETAAQERSQLSDKVQQLQAALSVASTSTAQQALAETKSIITRLNKEKTEMGQQILTLNATLAQYKSENERLKQQLSRGSSSNTTTSPVATSSPAGSRAGSTAGSRTGSTSGSYKTGSVGSRTAVDASPAGSRTGSAASSTVGAGSRTSSTAGSRTPGPSNPAANGTSTTNSPDAKPKLNPAATGASSGVAAEPRPFCDICDVFDKHDTDDCPTQTMDHPTVPAAKAPAASSVEPRPFCEPCSEFGHNTEDCDEQTF